MAISINQPDPKRQEQSRYPCKIEYNRRRIAQA
jgi:hypothetical protein